VRPDLRELPALRERELRETQDLPVLPVERALQVLRGLQGQPVRPGLQDQVQPELRELQAFKASTGWTVLEEQQVRRALREPQARQDPDPPEPQGRPE
jgi:hypothetical protein